MVAAVVPHVHRATAAGGVDRQYAVVADHPQVDARGVGQRHRYQIPERRGPQAGVVGGGGEQSTGAQTPGLLGSGGDGEQVGIRRALHQPAPGRGVTAQHGVGEPAPFRVRVRVHGAGADVGGAQVVQHRPHRVRARLRERVGQFGAVQPVVQQPAQPRHVHGGPLRQGVLAAGPGEHRGEEAVAVAVRRDQAELVSLRPDRCAGAARQVEAVRGVRVRRGVLARAGARPGAGLRPGPGGCGGRAAREQIRSAADQGRRVLGAQPQLGQGQRGVGELPGDPGRGRVLQAPYVVRPDEGARRQFGQWRRQQCPQRGLGTRRAQGGGLPQEPGVLRRRGRRSVGEAVPVGDHAGEQVGRHPGVGVAARRVRGTPAQPVDEGQCAQQLPVVTALFGVRAQRAAQRPHLLEGVGADEGVGRAASPVQPGGTGQRVQLPAGRLRGEQPPLARAVRPVEQHRPYLAAGIPGSARLGGRRVHRPAGPVRHVLCHREPRDLRRQAGFAGEEHDRPAPSAADAPVPQHFAQLSAAHHDGRQVGAVRAQRDGAGCAVRDDVVGALRGARPRQRPVRPGEHGARHPGAVVAVRNRRCPAQALVGVLAQERLPLHGPAAAVLGRALGEGDGPYRAAAGRRARCVRDQSADLLHRHRVPVERADLGRSGAAEARRARQQPRQRRAAPSRAARDGRGDAVRGDHDGAGGRGRGGGSHRVRCVRGGLQAHVDRRLVPVGVPRNADVRARPGGVPGAGRRGEDGPVVPGRCGLRRGLVLRLRDGGVGPGRGFTFVRAAAGGRRAGAVRHAGRVAGGGRRDGDRPGDRRIRPRRTGGVVGGPTRATRVRRLPGRGVVVRALLRRGARGRERTRCRHRAVPGARGRTATRGRRGRAHPVSRTAVRCRAGRGRDGGAHGRGALRDGARRRGGEAQVPRDPGGEDSGERNQHVGARERAGAHRATAGRVLLGQGRGGQRTYVDGAVRSLAGQ